MESQWKIEMHLVKLGHPCEAHHRFPKALGRNKRETLQKKLHMTEYRVHFLEGSSAAGGAMHEGFRTWIDQSGLAVGHDLLWSTQMPKCRLRLHPLGDTYADPQCAVNMMHAGWLGPSDTKIEYKWRASTTDPSLTFFSASPSLP
jgi:hypothetical protein